MLFKGCCSTNIRTLKFGTLKTIIALFIFFMGEVYLLHLNLPSIGRRVR